MTKEAVTKIKETEARAEKIIEDARITSKSMVNAAEKESREALVRFEDELRADYKADIVRLTGEVSEIVEKNFAEDNKRYKLGEGIARQHMNDAVKIILQGVVSECQ